MTTVATPQRVRELVKETGALLLAHNYQLPEVQDVADYIGDSLELAGKAADAEAGLIVFCGVHFMAETAAILNPEATVLEPDPNAGCPLADMLGADGLRELKSEHPGAVVVTYVNSSAEVKAESDYCCTSGNALKVVSSIGEGREIIFGPDKSLGQFVESRLGRELILWEGYCPTHHRITPDAVRQARKAHPEAKVVVHPECTPDVTALADEVASTSGILRYVGETPADEFIIGTENGMLHRLEKEYPGKRFYHVTTLAVCPNMKLNTLEKIVDSLEEGKYVVEVPGEIASAARRALERMVQLV